jgi:hypothetical protein
LKVARDIKRKEKEAPTPAPIFTKIEFNIKSFISGRGHEAIIKKHQCLAEVKKDIFIINLQDIREEATIACNGKKPKRENNVIEVNAVDILSDGLTVCYPRPKKIEEPIEAKEQQKKEVISNIPSLLVEEK